MLGSCSAARLAGANSFHCLAGYERDRLHAAAGIAVVKSKLAGGLTRVKYMQEVTGCLQQADP
jgi:hypothetical protein